MCTGDRELTYSCTRVGRDRDHDRPRPLSWIVPCRGGSKLVGRGSPPVVVICYSTYERGGGEGGQHTCRSTNSLQVKSRPQRIVLSCCLGLPKYVESCTERAQLYDRDGGGRTTGREG